MGIGFNSNIAAMRAERLLGQSSQSLRNIFERLSSGSRINRASDDAAGLSIATRLNTDTRVYTQGVRNVNDGISALNIAQGTVSELSGIVFRLRELSTQAANGSFQLTQRLSMDTEAYALTNEYNRLVASSSFNKLKLLDGSLSRMNIQAGYGTENTQSLALGSQLQRNVGTGQFQYSGIGSLASTFNQFANGDFDGDGKLDIISTDTQSTNFSFIHGNGDGTFAAESARTKPLKGDQTIAADVNNDGRLDLVMGSSAGETYVLLGNGNGTFQAVKTLTAGAGTSHIAVGDVNGDNYADVVASDTGGSFVSVFIGNGDGSFRARSSYALSAAANSVALADVNGDSRLDIIASGTKLSLLLGAGSGAFSSEQVISSSVSSSNNSLVQSADMNHDGKADLVVTGTIGGLNKVLTFMGNGDGSYQASKSMSVSINSLVTLDLVDLNNDGYTDIFGIEQISAADAYLNNGDGSFRAVNNGGSVGDSGFGTVGDFNSDGVLDFIGGENNAFYVNLGIKDQSTSTLRFDLTTQASARSALTLLDQLYQRVSNELGSIGTAQSRLGVTLNSLEQARLTSTTAEGRIKDADIATESAGLVKSQILQQVGAAVLAQANQSPYIALNLLQQAGR